jgi:hypothetical protein
LVIEELRRCETNEDPFGARRALSLARQFGILGIPVADDVQARAARCLVFELTVTSNTSWTIADYVTTIANVSANVPLGLGSNAGPLQVSLWDARPHGILQDVACVTTSPSYTFDAPAFVIAELGFIPESYEPSTEQLYLDVIPGNDLIDFSFTCPAGEEQYQIPQAFSSVYGLVFRTSHVHERVGKDGSYRITGWQKIAGSRWAAEVRFERAESDGTWSWMESTRMVLRHAPQTG